MREYIELLKEAVDTPKIDRSAFIYLPPKGDDFADCKTCLHFKPESERCAIFGPDDKVTADQSCGLYLHGAAKENQPCLSIVTPEQAGLVDGPVRCENCSWLDGTTCGLYRTLMQKVPDVFDLDTKVSPKGCCNAWQSNDR